MDGSQLCSMYALVAEMHSLEAGIEAMKALNQVRETAGYAFAYDEDSFRVEQTRFAEIATALHKLAQT